MNFIDLACKFHKILGGAELCFQLVLILPGGLGKAHAAHAR